MKALSIIQPWASLIAIGAKNIETRSYQTHYRGSVAIHASKRMPQDCGIWCFEEPFKTALAEFFKNGSIYLPTGTIVAVADLVDCVPVEAIAPGLLTKQEEAFGNYDSGRYGWIMSNVKRLQQPILCKGALGLWTVPAEIEERLK